MKFKVLPDPPESLSAIEERHAAVPLVPEDERTCCMRLVSTTDVDSQDHAKEWLTFFRALELVSKTDDGYRRRRVEPDPEAMRRAFRDRIYLVEDVLETVGSATEPLDEDEVFDRLADRLPPWERLRHTDPEAVWREQVRRILEWAVLFDLLEPSSAGYARS